MTQAAATEAINARAATADVLTRTNTTAYAPAAPYHPATKKYVDDSISSSGNGDMMKSVYDTNNDGVVDKAATLAAARAFSITGNVTAAAVSFNGSGNVALNAGEVKATEIQEVTF
jgi:hypothetical protein